MKPKKKMETPNTFSKLLKGTDSKDYYDTVKIPQKGIAKITMSKFR